MTSSFERALNSYGIDLSKAPTIEDKMIRDFRRKYEGGDSEMVIEDTFYCLSLLTINTEDELREAYEDLRLMNITHESLFPGLDGFAKSLKQNFYLYRDLPHIKAKLREKN